MKKFDRIFWIVTDSLGVGNDKRDKEFGDENANTLKHINDTGLLQIPTLKKMGLLNLVDDNMPNIDQTAYTLRLNELSNAKDTLAGHWEMMGLKTKIPFPAFAENGFPKELIDKLTKAFDNREIVGNKAASGTTIIDELADEEIKNKKIIVYTSTDSVLQICGHEKYMGLDNLYKYGQAAREICSSKPEWNVGRIIVRPYVGTKGNYQRTSNRKDYAVEPKEMILDVLQKQNKAPITAIGKIKDIYCNHGIDKYIPSKSNEDGMDSFIKLIKEDTTNQFVMINLVEFDSHCGHRRDVKKYAKYLNNFDKRIKETLEIIKENDLLIITSDHGNDPTFPGWNHTRENVPATIYSKRFKSPKKLKTANGFGTLGNILCENWDLPKTNNGEIITDKLI